VEQTNGDGSVSALTFQDNGGTCISVTSHTILVTQSVRNTNSVRPSPPPAPAITLGDWLFTPPSTKSNNLVAKPWPCHLR
jgi:hypothetical protein